MKFKLLIAVLLFSFTPSFAQNLSKGYVSQIMNAGRIVDGKELQVADLPFTKGQGVPFSLIIVPKSSSNTNEVEIVKARYYQGDVVRDVPISINQWNVVALVLFTEDNEYLFNDYRVFIGYGQQGE